MGTAHGVYHTAPKLDLARIPLIQAQADLPLVLHGASGAAGHSGAGSCGQGNGQGQFCHRAAADLYRGSPKGFGAGTAGVRPQKISGPGSKKRTKASGAENSGVRCGRSGINDIEASCWAGCGPALFVGGVFLPAGGKVIDKAVCPAETPKKFFLQMVFGLCGCRSGTCSDRENKRLVWRHLPGEYLCSLHSHRSPCLCKAGRLLAFRIRGKRYKRIVLVAGVFFKEFICFPSLFHRIDRKEW